MKKKILFFHFDMKGGGAENVLVNLVNNLDPEKYDITIQLLFGCGANLERLNKNIHVKYLFKRQFKGLTTIMRYFSPRLLHRLLIRDRYDLEIAYLETSPTRIVSGCPYPETKKAAWIHVELYQLPWFKNKEEMKHCYEQFDKIVCVSQNALDTFKETTQLLDLPFVVVHNVVESDKIIRMSKESIDLMPDSSVVNLCSVGRFSEQKAPLRLLAVLNKIKESGVTNWHYYAIGGGELLGSAKEFVSSHQMDDYVTFLGFRKNPFSYLSKMDVFVNTTLREGYSTATTEAIILKKPVLVTNTSGMDEILDNGKYGLVVDNSEESIYNGLYQIISDSACLKHYQEMAEKRSSSFEKQKLLHDNIILIDSLLS